jgi:hypothetical protein
VFNVSRSAQARLRLRTAAMPQRALTVGRCDRNTRR